MSSGGKADSDEATALARRLVALPEAGMRQGALVDYLRATAPSEVAPVLERIHREGSRGGPPFSVALVTLAQVLNGEKLPYELTAELYRATQTMGFGAVGRLLLSGPANPAPSPARSDDERELTLGHRKSMARSTDRDVLARLLRNPEPAVIEQLLENPRLTESDVVRLAARRPAAAEVQRLIGASARWVSRYGVKRALVLNRYTPVELSIRLLALLVHGDLQLIKASPTLPEALRNAAAEMIDTRETRRADQVAQ